MLLFWKLVYNLVFIPVFLLVFLASALFQAKIRRSLRRFGACRRIRKGLQTAGVADQTIWFHVASVGEFLQAKPVIESLQNSFAAQNKKLHIVLTFTSPSGIDWTKNNQSITVIDYYPFDDLWQVHSLLKAIKPAALVLVKYDTWPNLVWQAQKICPVFLVSATLQPASHRLHPVLRPFFRQVYGQISQILTVSKADSRRFLQTAPGHSAVITCGDSRVDSVLERMQTVKLPENLSPKNNRLLLIAGSTWPQDEKLIISAWPQIRNSVPTVSLLLVPHEPTAAHLAQLADSLQKEQLSSVLLSEWNQSIPESSWPDVVLVDKMGILASLYQIADLAFVGAGKGGVHNVMEPAIWGLPVFFRPCYHNSPEAAELLARQAAFVTATSLELAEQSIHLLQNPALAKEAGIRGKNYLLENSGAASKAARIILKEISSHV